MIIYLDTSALVKKYFRESGSADVISLWRNASAIVTSSVVYAETMASFHRKKRESGMDGNIFDPIVRSFRADYQSLTLVQVGGELNSIIDRIVSLYPLRGFDAIHLSSALVIQNSLSENLLFVCFDQRLLDAARTEGLDTFQ
ncbi:MAG: hypothetical protein B6245_00330 [Desulfobacteraceae bacterium 4572_88]|nr:MAG: hypothetical protein B6245_00330 [Desulfobacteraceae bacterium 4572_88]